MSYIVIKKTQLFIYRVLASSPESR